MRLLVALALLPALLVTVPALATPTDNLPELSPIARAHLDDGLRHHEGGRYEAAVAAFRAGFELEPAPVFLFALAQAERLSGDCRSAATYYRKFLATNPVELHAAAARKMLARCQTAIASTPTTVAMTTGSRRRHSPALTSPAPLAEARPRDPVATSLLVVGVTSTALGVGFLLAAHADESAASAAGDYGEFSTLAGSAQRNQDIAAIAIGSGAVLLSAYLLRRLWRRHRRPAALSARAERLHVTMSF